MKFDFNKLTQDGKDKLKALLQEYNVIPSATPAVTPAPVVDQAPVQKFGEGKLKDGTVIKWEGDGAIAVGFPVMVIDPANPTAFLPAPDGTHEMEDGTVIETKDGKVSAVTPVAPANPAPVAPDMTAQVAQMESQLKEVNEKFASVSSEKEKLNADLETLKAEFEAQKAKLEKAEADIKGTLQMFKEAMEMPSANPTEPVQNKMSKHEKLMKELFNK